MTIESKPAARPPPDPSVALREVLGEILKDLAWMNHHLHRLPSLNMLRAEALLASLEGAATAPAEGVDGQDALREARDAAYSERNQCVALILRMALALGWRAGVGRHEDKPGETWEDDWRTLVSVDLPTGQASWHFHDSERGLLAGLPAYPAPWDGHDTPEKYRRVAAALAAPQPLPFAKPQEVKCENPYHLKTGSHTGSTCYTLLTDQRYVPPEGHPATTGHNPEGVPAEGPQPQPQPLRMKERCR